MSLAPIVDRSVITASPTRLSVAQRGSVANVGPNVDSVTTATPTVEVPSAGTVTTQADVQANRQRLQAAVDAANKFLQPVARNLQFSIDDDSGKTIVKVIDTETDKVVRQIPSEEMLAISRALGRFKGEVKGVMVEQHA